MDIQQILFASESINFLIVHFEVFMSARSLEWRLAIRVDGAWEIQDADGNCSNVW